MDLAANPFDAIPVKGWVLFFLAAVAWAPASYVWNYLTHERRPRDITLPPEDLSWKTRGQLFRSGAILIAVGLLACFIFTPWAESFARSDWFIPSLLGLVGSYALGTLLPAWRKGKIEPLVRGISVEYDREDQPLRFWTSFAWNGVFGVAMMLFSVTLADNAASPVFDGPDGREGRALRGYALEEFGNLQNSGFGPDQLSVIMTARARIMGHLGRDLHAGGDGPDDRLNRGLANAALNDVELAHSDFSQFSPGDPQWPEVLGGRAILAIHRKAYADAVALTSAGLEARPNDPFLLRLRAEAYWQSGRDDLARDDDDRRMDIEDALEKR